jgi:hypothetical protein
MNAYKILVGKSEGKILLGRIILKCILKNYGVSQWTAFNWLRVGSSSGLL